MHQRRRSYRCRGFESLAFRLRRRRISVGDDVCFFGKRANEGEPQPSRFNQNLTFPAPAASVWLAEGLARVDGGLGWSLRVETPQASIDGSF